MRKSPIRHTVRTHKRKNRVVHQYPRGHGSRPPKLANPRMRHVQQNLNYLVEINYNARPSEKIPVVASSYPDAIEQALMCRNHITPPNQIDVKPLR